MRYFIKDISDEKLKEIIAPGSDIICVKKGKCDLLKKNLFTHVRVVFSTDR